MKRELIYEIEITACGTFIERPNRFIAHVKLENGQEVVAHVHDSGRLKELLFAGNKVWLRKATDTSNRKTEWDMIAALSVEGEQVLINSSFHRKLTDIIFNNKNFSPFKNFNSVKAEVKYGKSRLDYLIETDTGKIWIETKGVSLAENKIAKFPDAPSIRATKHLNELIELKEGGDRAAVALIILRDVKSFEPKWDTDPVFSKTFYEAISKGVEVYPITLDYEDGKIYWTDRVVEILKNKMK